MSHFNMTLLDMRLFGGFNAIESRYFAVNIYRGGSSFQQTHTMIEQQRCQISIKMQREKKIMSWNSVFHPSETYRLHGNRLIKVLKPCKWRRAAAKSGSGPPPQYRIGGTDKTSELISRLAQQRQFALKMIVFVFPDGVKLLSTSSEVKKRWCARAFGFSEDVGQPKCGFNIIEAVTGDFVVFQYSLWGMVLVSPFHNHVGAAKWGFRRC